MRDRRWEKVTAQIMHTTTPFIDDNDQIDERWGIKVLIEVELEGIIWYQTQLFDMEDWDELIASNNEAFRFLMDKMVYQLDKTLDEAGV